MLKIFSFLFVCTTLFSQDNVDTITINASEILQPTKMFVGILGDSKAPFCQQIVADFKHCCQWSGRFEPTIAWLKKMPKKRSSVQKLFDQEYDCAVFITCDDQRVGDQRAGDKRVGVIEWRLYDTIEGQMLQGKKLATDDVQKTARLLATQVLHELTHEPQPYMSKLVYRKREKKGRMGAGACSLVVTDFDGSNIQTIMRSPQRIVVAPRWTLDKQRPAIVFSEFTPTNVRLKMCDMGGKSAVIFDAEGTTVGVSFTHDAKKVFYCRSGDIWEYHYDAQQKKGIHHRLIHDDKVCSHPTVLANGDIVYASQGTLKKYDAVTKKSHTLPISGYCVSPCYSPVADGIVYAKRVNGQMQIWVYDVWAQKDRQITFASSQVDDRDYRADKTDPFWAPDGVHVVFCWERGEKSRIAMLNTLTKQYHFITPEHEHCSYPAWSGNLF